MTDKIKALVTGATGDIGSAIAKQLAADGYFVWVHANTQLQKAEKIVEEISQVGGDAEAVQFNLTDEIATAQAAEQILDSGVVQVIVNNAGIHDDAVMAGMSTAQWKKVVDVSLNGFFNITQPLLLPMIRTRWGRVINISSVAGVLGNRGQVNYAAAKAGIIGASKSLALELASRRITVNVVAPGVIKGKMSEDSFSNDMVKQIVPMQRSGTPQEVADLVSFLASEKSAYITGQTFSIDGGMA